MTNAASDNKKQNSTDCPSLYDRTPLLCIRRPKKNKQPHSLGMNSASGERKSVIDPAGCQEYLMNSGPAIENIVHGLIRQFLVYTQLALISAWCKVNLLCAQKMCLPRYSSPDILMSRVKWRIGNRAASTSCFSPCTITWTFVDGHLARYGHNPTSYFVQCPQACPSDMEQRISCTPSPTIFAHGGDCARPPGGLNCVLIRKTTL